MLPSTTRLPSTVPSAPLPVGESKSVTAGIPILRPSAALTIASARGCSDDRSTAAASRSTVSSLNPVPEMIRVTDGWPSVSVPVLSTIKVSIFSIRSRASAFLIRTPKPAPRPTPTMIDMGVARPSAQGQAMISTATAATKP